MKKYSLLLLPILTGFIFTACDSECCGPVEAKPAPAPQPEPQRNVKPTAKIDNFGANAVKECTPGETVTLTNNSTDPDNNLDNTTVTWEGTINGTNTVACPNPGETTQVCLSVQDTEGLSDKTCITLKGKAVVNQTLPPLFELAPDNEKGAGYIKCIKLEDPDNIDSDGIENPYGKNKQIKEIYWNITYADGTGHDVTQTEWNNQEAAYPEGSCGKWIKHDDNSVPVKIKVKPVDDEGEEKTYEYTYTVDANGNGVVTFIKAE